MRLRGILKRFFGKKTKTGASLIVVIVAVTLLIVMGSTFSVIAMTAYNNSNRRLCQQQAYYTAEACLNILSTQFANDPDGTYMQEIKTKIAAAYDPTIHDKVSDVQVVVAELKDPEVTGEAFIPTNAPEASLLGITGGCVIKAAAVEDTPTTDAISAIKLMSTGTYKGYSHTLTARMQVTTKGSIELKKIFSNSQCWKTPVVTLIAGETTGDMYFLSPGEYIRWPNGEIRMDSAIEPTTGKTYRKYNEDIRDTIYGDVASGNTKNKGKVHTRPFGIDNKPLKLPATRCIPMLDIADVEAIKYFDYAKIGTMGMGYPYYDKAKNNAFSKYRGQVNSLISDLTTTLTTTDPGNDMEYANFYYKKSDHGNFYGPNAENFLLQLNGVSHGYGGVNLDQEVLEEYFTFKRPDAFNTLYPQTDMWYNDWVEIYMFTGQHGPNQPSVVNGDMYVNTQALIGLYDKDKLQINYWPYRDVVTHRDKVEQKYVSYGAASHAESDYYFLDDFAFYRDLYRNGYAFGPNFEHGGDAGKDLFFDYNETPPTFDKSVMSHNGNMYLFKDARIECYDSTHTQNAVNGIKNNIFAHQNLVIDGTAFKQGLIEEKNGDKSKIGRQYINYKLNHVYPERNVSIYGDIMVEGDLMISNATIYGDVYCNGKNMYLADCDIYGNVYYNGSHLVADNAHIRDDEKTMLRNDDGTLDKASKGKITTPQGKTVTSYSFQNDNKKGVRLNGGDLVILGNNALPGMKYDNGKENKDTLAFASQEQRFTAERNNRDLWGARLTNCSVSGTLYSEVGTSINSMFKRAEDYVDADGLLPTRASCADGRTVIDGQVIEDTYNNIVINGQLMFDLREKYRHDLSHGDQNYLAALCNNAVTVEGFCIAQRVQIVQTQAGDAGFGHRHNFTRYEVGAITNPGWGLNKDTSIEDVRTHTRFSPGYIADRGKDIFGTRHFRCSNVHIHILNVGDGGLYLDGSNWYYQHYNETTFSKDNSWWAEHPGKNQQHVSIIIDEIYTTMNLTGQYDLNGEIKNTASKFACYNTGGQPTNATEYANTEIYTPLATTNYFRGESGPVHFNQWELSAIHIKIYDQLYDMIAQEIKDRESNKLKGDETNKAKAATLPAKGTDLKSVTSIIAVLTDYYMLTKAPHRINAYYKHMSEAMNYRGYKEIGDIRTWASNKKGEGPYPMYDPQATDGVWRQIKMLEWSAPSGIEPQNINTSGENNGIVAVPKSAKFNNNKDTHTQCYYTSSAPGITDIIPTKENIIQRDADGNMIVMSSINVDHKLYVPDGKKLIFDTSKNNLHCTIHGGIILGKKSQIVLRGGNMTFLYLENDDYDSTKPPEDKSNLVLGMEEESVIGVVDNSQNVEKPNDSLYIVSNDPCLIHMKTMAQIKGFIYAPKGYLKIDEFEPGTDTPKAEGSTNTVLHGSLVVRSFIVDMTMGYNSIHGMYKNLKYEYVMAPLICDTNISFGDNADQIEDFQTPQWGFIGYD